MYFISNCGNNLDLDQQVLSGIFTWLIIFNVMGNMYFNSNCGNNLDLNQQVLSGIFTWLITFNVMGNMYFNSNSGNNLDLDQQVLSGKVALDAVAHSLALLVHPCVPDLCLQ